MEKFFLEYNMAPFGTDLHHQAWFTIAFHQLYLGIGCVRVAEATHQKNSNFSTGVFA